jgi:putative transposase
LKYIRFKIGKRYFFVFDAISTDVDHLHLFIGAELKYPLSIVMQIINSTTARKVFKEYSEIKKIMCDRLKCN